MKGTWVRTARAIFAFAVCSVLVFLVDVASTALAASDSLPFLRIGVGARSATLGGGGVLADDGFAVFYNPAALGYARRWGWGASYSRWFADTYDAALVFHRQFDWLASRKTYVALGLRYFGSPTWDSTDGAAVPVSASHSVVQVALGQRVDWRELGFLRRHLALGMSLRLVRSQLGGYNGLAVHSSLGGVLRLGRFALGPLGLGIFRFGEMHLGSMLGNALGFSRAFERTKTQLPRNLSVATSIRLSAHEKWELLMSYYYSKEWSGRGERGLGAELIWNRLVALRFGYRPDETLCRFVLGLGLTADGLRVGFPTLAGLRNSYVSLDVSGGDYGALFGWTQRSTVAHYPNGPEPFAMLRPAESTVVDGPRVHFEWEAAEDPDLADELQYVLAVDTDLGTLQNAVRCLEAGMLKASGLDSLLLFTRVEGTSLDTTIAPVGTLFYWTVAAVDLDGHVRVGHGSPQVRSFRVRWPDLTVTSTNLEPTTWLTGKNNPEQGDIVVRVRNMGDRSVGRYHLKVRWVCLDSTGGGRSTVDSLLIHADEKKLLRFYGGEWYQNQTSMLPANAVREFRYKWKTAAPGRYRFCAIVAAGSDSTVEEVNIKNNRRFATVVTVPKWQTPEPFRIPAKNRFRVSLIRYKAIAVPLVPMVFFAKGDTNVSRMYIDGGAIPAVLSVVADRVKKNSGATVVVKGYVDRISEPGVGAQLALARARAVKRELVRLGVPAARVRISRSHNVFHRRIQRRPTNKQDRDWIGEENRRVELTTTSAYEKALFGPVELRVQPRIAERDPRTEAPSFEVRVGAPVNLRSWTVELLDRKNLLASLVGKQNSLGRAIDTTVWWDGKCLGGSPPPTHIPILCRVRVEDALGRSFVTHEQSFRLEEVVSVVREEIFALFKFADVEVPFSFYLAQLEPIAEEFAASPELRIRFEGHADATGPEDENLRLSRQRAQEITEAFRKILRRKYPKRYRDLWRRVDEPRWFGEGVPLVIDVADEKELLLGNNDDPVGRNRNRRVMILLYRQKSE